MDRMSVKKTLLIKLGVLLAAGIIFFCVPGVQEFTYSSLDHLRHHDFDQVRQFVLAYGGWAPVVGILMMIIQTLVPFVPGMVITITNAWVFGWPLGALYSWLGSFLGATLDFGIARWYGRPAVEKLVNAKYLDKTDTFIKDNGVLAIFITRLTPVVPFKIVSYGAGLTGMAFGSYCWATALGQTPAIVLYSFLGQYLTSNLKVTVVVTTLLLLLAGLAYYYRKKIYQRLFFHKNSD
ncbi:MAG: associated protein [Firmicutes bacterium]|nr:associated protein [Bacillota bacterium]